jgi:hypothetical protein
MYLAYEIFFARTAFVCYDGIRSVGEKPKVEANFVAEKVIGIELAPWVFWADYLVAAIAPRKFPVAVFIPRVQHKQERLDQVVVACFFFNSNIHSV